GCNDADSCNDCAGVPNGDSALDDCGVCDGGNADQDCAGVCFGDSALDDCGVCDGGNADQDCAGECFGDSALDDCGVCDGGNADQDCAGVCFGDSALDDCGVCDGDNADDLGCGCFEDGPSGCDNECGSTAVEDNCGVCDGDGTSCLASLSLGAFDSSGTLEVLYDFGGPVAGFQFDVTGLALTGGSGGAAGDTGMTVSAGGATVLGFSFDNSEIAAGSGTLTVLSFSSVTAGSTELSLGNFGAVTDASGNVYTTSASDSINHGDPDCTGTYYGDAEELACGCNDADSCNDCAGVPNGD
ncbi:uncharacterized protein METZ01_LOCUS378952, partial [marine metagenome]